MLEILVEQGIYELLFYSFLDEIKNFSPYAFLAQIHFIAFVLFFNYPHLKNSKSWSFLNSSNKIILVFSIIFVAMIFLQQKFEFLHFFKDVMVFIIATILFRKFQRYFFFLILI